MSQAQYPPPQAEWPAGAAPAAARQRFPGGHLPDLGQAFSEVMQSFMNELGPYALAGLGLMLAMIPVVLIMLVVIYGGIAIAIFGLIASGQAQAGSEEGGLLTLGIVGGVMLLVFLGALVTNALMAPFAASTLRAVARHQRGEQELTFSAPFSTARQDLAPVIGTMVIVGLISMIALMFCVFPVFIAAFLLLFAFPLAVLHRLPAMAAIRASSALTRGAVWWHLKFFAIMMLMNMLGGNVPVLGPMFALAYLVRVYRELVGDGEQPALTGRA